MPNPNAHLLLEKKQFLRKMLKRLNLHNTTLTQQVSDCNSIEQCNSLAKTYALQFFKFNLVEQFEEFDLLTKEVTRKIENAISINQLERQTKIERQELNIRMVREDDFKRSLIGSEYISTKQSIRAIYTGMIY